MPRGLFPAGDPVVEHLEGFAAHEIVYTCRADEHRATDGTSTYGPWQAAYRVIDPQALLDGYALPDDTRIVTGCPGRGSAPARRARPRRRGRFGRRMTGWR